MHEITFQEAFPVLLRQTGIPTDGEPLPKIIRLLSGLNGKTKFYRFRVNNFKEDAFSASFNVLSKL